MNVVSGWLLRMKDRLNPIVVKELRQISRGKFLVTILLGFLAAQLIITGMFSFLADDRSLVTGPWLFQFLIGVLLATSALLVPAYAGFRLANERADANVDLLYISSLTPMSIVWGKTLSSATLTAIIYSVCIPFIAMTYLLRGIDLPSVFLALAVSFAFALLAIQIGIFIGCLPANRVVKGIVGLCAFFFLMSLMMISLGAATFSVGAGSSLLDAISTRDGLLTLLTAAITAALVWGLLYLFSASMLSPAASNRAFAPRIYLTAACAATFIVCAVWCDAMSTPLPLIIWVNIVMVLFGWAMFVAVSERDSIGLRVRSKIPRKPAWRVPAFLFYSGSAGGLLWAVLGSAASYYAVLTTLEHLVIRFSLSLTREMDAAMSNAAFSGLNFVIAAVAAMLIHRRFLQNRISAVHTWMIAFGVSMFVGLGWVVFAMTPAAGSGRGLGPVGVFIQLDAFENQPVGPAAIAAAVLAAAAVPWIVRQIRGFKPISADKTRPDSIGTA